MNQYQHIKEAEKYMRTHHSEDSTGHDIQHVMRVVNGFIYCRARR